MDRALGKPVASVEVNQSGSMDIRWRDDLASRIIEARKRVDAASPDQAFLERPICSSARAASTLA